MRPGIPSCLHLQYRKRKSDLFQVQTMCLPTDTFCMTSLLKRLCIMYLEELSALWKMMLFVETQKALLYISHASHPARTMPSHLFPQQTSCLLPNLLSLQSHLLVPSMNNTGHTCHHPSSGSLLWYSISHIRNGRQAS